MVTLLGSSGAGKMQGLNLLGSKSAALGFEQIGADFDKLARLLQYCK
ncbi:MAG: hypothetical protein RIN56_07325 [Sporomusaceae bacterium]|nr:hypothetical protein [Sporomusaceae bacterium]